MAHKYNPKLNMPKELLQKIRSVDKEAWEWLVNEYDGVPEMYYWNNLSGAFEWDKTPQGSAYWCGICELIGEDLR